MTEGFRDGVSIGPRTSRRRCSRPERLSKISRFKTNVKTSRFKFLEIIHDFCGPTRGGMDRIDPILSIDPILFNKIFSSDSPLENLQLKFD